MVVGEGRSVAGEVEEGLGVLLGQAVAGSGKAGAPRRLPQPEKMARDSSCQGPGEDGSGDARRWGSWGGGGWRIRLRIWWGAD